MRLRLPDAGTRNGRAQRKPDTNQNTTFLQSTSIDCIEYRTTTTGGGRGASRDTYVLAGRLRTAWLSSLPSGVGAPDEPQMVEIELVTPLWRSKKWLQLVQEILTIQRIPLRGPEACVADDSPQLFFRSAIRDASGPDYVFFQHD